MHWLVYVLTFPEELIWPGLRDGWYPLVALLWLPVGGYFFVRAWIEEG